MIPFLSIAKSLVQFIPAIITGVFVWFVSSSISSHKLASTVKDMEVAQATAIANERSICIENQAITEETSNALQRSLTDTNDRLAAIVKRVRAQGAGTGLPVASAASGHDDAASGNLPAVRGGGMAERLPDAAAACDRQTAQLIACQGFIRATWADHQFKSTPR